MTTADLDRHAASLTLALHGVVEALDLAAVYTVTEAADDPRALELAHLMQAAGETGPDARDTRVLATGYVETRATEGDPRAVLLTRFIVAAFDRLAVENIAAVTTKEKYRDES